MKRTAYLATVLSLTAFVLGQQNIIRDYDRTRDFSQYKTYAWQKDDPMVIFRANPDDTSGMSDEEADQLLREEIEATLAKKGFSESDRDNADLLVAYFLVAEYDLGIEQYDPGASGWDRINYGHWRPFYEPGKDKRLTRKGTLTLDMIDNSDQKLAWRGSATETVKSPKDAPNRIRKAVSRILKPFPPKK